MGSEWELKRLADVASITMGQSPPGSTYNEVGEGVMFFQGVKDFGARHPSPRVYCTAPTRFAEPGDILFSVRAPIGEINRAVEKCCIGRGLAAIRGDDGYDTDFLEYVLRSIRHEWRILEGQGAVFGNAKKSDLENLKIPWPKKRERYAIARILGTLDDKIELNRRMNETLEAMAQALFKSWFVDFDPVVVNALRAGNPIPEKFAARAAYYRQLLNQQNSPLLLGEGLGVRAYSPSPPGRGARGERKLPPKLLAYARSLRKNQTDAERLMWYLLRNRQFLGIKFRRQHPIPPYIVDFYAHELGLVIEIDGGQHAQPKQKAYDEKRTAFLEEKGLTVIRYWANDVVRETEAVLQDLYERVLEMMPSPPSPPSPPAPLPEGEGGVLGLPEDILRLFPDHFVDSELGPIPERWEVRPIGEVVRCVGGATPSTKKPEYWEGGTNPFLTPKDMASLDAPVVLDTERHITDAGVERISSGQLLVGTVLLSSRAPIGYLAINAVPVSVNQGIIAMICEGNVSNYYVYFWVKENLLVIKGKAGGTTFPEISKTHFRSIPMLIPLIASLEKFGSITGSIFTMILENAKSSRTLAALRDTLLPKLISGKLRVPDVEKILERSDL